VIDAAAQVCQIFDPAGKLLLFFGERAGAAAPLDLPAAVAVDYDHVWAVSTLRCPRLRAGTSGDHHEPTRPRKVSVYGLGHKKWSPVIACEAAIAMAPQDLHNVRCVAAGCRVQFTGQRSPASAPSSRGGPATTHPRRGVPRPLLAPIVAASSAPRQLPWPAFLHAPFAKTQTVRPCHTTRPCPGLRAVAAASVSRLPRQTDRQRPVRHCHRSAVEDATSVTCRMNRRSVSS